MLPVLGLVRGEKLKAIAIAAERRSELLPDVPTFREQGLDYRTGTWFGMLAPAKTQPDIIDKLHRNSVAVLQDAGVRAKIIEQGAEVIANSPAEFRAFLNEETKLARDRDTQREDHARLNPSSSAPRRRPMRRCLIRPHGRSGDPSGHGRPRADRLSVACRPHHRAVSAGLRHRPAVAAHQRSAQPQMERLGDHRKRAGVRQHRRVRGLPRGARRPHADDRATRTDRNQQIPVQGPGLRFDQMGRRLVAYHRALRADHACEVYRRLQGTDGAGEGEWARSRPPFRDRAAPHICRSPISNPWPASNSCTCLIAGSAPR